MAHRHKRKVHKRGQRKRKLQPQYDPPAIFNYNALRLVFELLNIEDLASAARVHQTWSQAANDEVMSRKRPERICKVISESGVTFDAKSFSAELKVKPKFSLFCEKYQRIVMKKDSCYCKSLPKNCYATIVKAQAILCDTNTPEQFSAHEMFACISIPEIPRLKVQMLIFKPRRFFNNSRRKRKHMINLFEKLEKVEKFGCVFIFTNRKGAQIMKQNRILTYFRNYAATRQLAIIGGQCQKLKACNSDPKIEMCSKSLVWTAVILYSPYMRNWSMVLPQVCHSNEKELLARLTSFRKSIADGLKRYCVGYIFSRKIVKKRFSAFKQVFPNVPIVALCGVKQFGWDTLNPLKEIVHTDSIVFLVSTYEFSNNDVKMPVLQYSSKL